MRRGLNAVGEHAIVVFLVCEIGDASNYPQISGKIEIPCKIEHLVRCNLRFRDLGVPNIRVLPELL